MGLFVVSLSDVGEGVAEAELIEWHVSVGDAVAEDQLLGVVMTDKAAVDVPSSVMGTVTKLCADIGDVIAVGSDLVHLDVDASLANAQTDEPANEPTTTSADPRANQVASDSTASAADNADTSHASIDNNKAESTGANEVSRSATARSDLQTQSSSTVASNKKALAAPSVRQRARELGVELGTVQGTGPGGRVVHEDLDQFTERRSSAGKGSRPDDSVNVVKVVGMRRKIAEKMELANARIPHITIVEEIDMHYLEELRIELNEKHADKKGKLTLLPFLMKSIAEAVKEQPMLNALYDDEAGTISQYKGVHIGIATQTPNGLLVPVVRHSEMNSLWENAAKVASLAQASRDGQVKREELGGSTITISSLGPLGAVATTPIINHPEVAIVGVNKMLVRPVWDGQQFIPRKMMNISCSFDHRVVDGWDAAVFVQNIKDLLEKPAMLFMES